MMSLAFPSLSFTHSSVIVAPKETNFAVIDPSGAVSVVRSNGCVCDGNDSDQHFGTDSKTEREVAHPVRSQHRLRRESDSDQQAHGQDEYAQQFRHHLRKSY